MLFRSFLIALQATKNINGEFFSVKTRQVSALTYKIGKGSTMVASAMKVPTTPTML
jgi:hypothetical protein